MGGRGGLTVVYLILAVLPEFLMLETTKLIYKKLLKHWGFVKLFMAIHFRLQFLFSMQLRFLYSCVGCIYAIKVLLDYISYTF